MFARLARIRAIPAWTIKSWASGAPRIKAWPAAPACANDNSAGSRVGLTQARRPRPVLSCHWVRDAASGRLECRWTEEESRQIGAEDPYGWHVMSRLYAQFAIALRLAAAMSPGPRAKAHRVESATSAFVPSPSKRGVRSGGPEWTLRSWRAGTAERALCRRVVATTGFARPPGRANCLGIRCRAPAPARG
jgi:hypothetical protein